MIQCGWEVVLSVLSLFEPIGRPASVAPCPFILSRPELGVVELQHQTRPPCSLTGHKVRSKVDLTVASPLVQKQEETVGAHSWMVNSSTI